MKTPNITRFARLPLGAQVVENWKKYGSMFLMILSYCWLSQKHPDPELYHLKRLVPFLDELHGVYTAEAYKFVTPQSLPDFGIILDFCSLWQNLSETVGEDSRTEDQKKEFDAGLKCINTPYVRWILMEGSVDKIHKIHVPQIQGRVFSEVAEAPQAARTQTRPAGRP